MVKVFKPNKTKPKSTSGKLLEVTIDGLDHQGRGIAKTQPITFVEGALPGESGKIRISKAQKQVRFANLVQLNQKSEFRQVEPCEYADQCGGCQTQYCQPEYMLQQKQEAVSGLIHKFTGLESNAIPWQPAVSAKTSQYRRKARLAVDCRDKQNIKLGFRGKDGKTVIDIKHCLVLQPDLSQLLGPLKTLLTHLSGRRHVGHISLFSGLEGVQVTVRITAKLSTEDTALLQAFAEQWGGQVLLEHQQQQYECLGQATETADYALSLRSLSQTSGTKQTDKLALRVRPNDFVQVNDEVNNLMVQQAMDWLVPEASDTCLDLFCGVGNFTLPLAKYHAHVIGFEVSAEMVQQAKQNAQLNGIENVDFICGDLCEEDTLAKIAETSFNKVLLDPARAGAYDAIAELIKHKPSSVLYVSCNPATFGRDIALLLHHNYRLTKISLLDMFPYTSHTEVMALFTQDNL